MTKFNLLNATKLSIICAISASACFSLSDVSIKFLSSDYSLYQIVFIRSLIGLFITIFIFVPFEGGFKALKTNRPFIHLARGFCLVLANMFFFAGIAILPIAECTAIFFVAPLLITFLSSVLLKEPVGIRRWSALLIGFIGVLIIVQPGQISFHWSTLLPLVAAICYAFLHTSTRYLGLSEKASTLTFYIQIAFLLVSSVMGLAFGDGDFSVYENASLEFLLRAWVVPNYNHISILLFLGVASSFGGYLISQAYRSSESGLVAPFEYTTLILAIIWGVTIWGEWPSLTSCFGILLILFSGIYVALREIHLGAKISVKKSSARR
tara:strand:+ start:392 stop:1360 length:969 start_codon:yes stop_codon:yes gene_type:complete